MEDGSGLLTVREVAKRLGVGVTSVYALIDRGELPYVQVLSRRRVEPSALEGFKTEHRIAPRTSRFEGRQPLTSTKRRTRGKTKARRVPRGEYSARIRLGPSIRKRIYAATQSELDAKIELELRRYSERPRHAGEAERVTLQAYIEEWLEDVKQTKRLATYQLRERTCRNHILPHLGSLKIGYIEAAHVRGLLKTLRSKNVGARTLQVVYATLSCVLRNAMKDELIPRSVVEIVDRPKAPKREKHILDESQAKRLLEAAKGDPYEALYVLALTTGLRQGELFALEWADVELQQAAIRVRATLTEDEDGNLVRSEPKTESSRRIVDLPKIAVKALRDHKAGTQVFEGFVFRDSNGGPLRKSNFLRRNFHPLLEQPRICEECKAQCLRGTLGACPECGSTRSKRAIPKITFHSLRHVANSVLLAQGADIRLLADRLGHSTTRTTIDHYSHVLTGRQREAADKLDAVFGGM